MNIGRAPTARPIAHAVGYVAMRKEVRNYRMSPLNRRQFDDVDLQE